MPHFSKKGFIIIAGIHKDTEYKLFEIPLCSDVKAIVKEDKPIAMIKYENLNYNTIPIYNKISQEFAFLGYYGIVLTTKNTETNELTVT